LLPVVSAYGDGERPACFFYLSRLELRYGQGQPWTGVIGKERSRFLETGNRLVEMTESIFRQATNEIDVGTVGVRKFGRHGNSPIHQGENTFSLAAFCWPQKTRQSVSLPYGPVIVCGDRTLEQHFASPKVRLFFLQKQA